MAWKIASTALMVFSLIMLFTAIVRGPANWLLIAISIMCVGIGAGMLINGY
jgi:hypothetical protein